MTQDDCILLQTGKNRYNTQYNIPTWDLLVGTFPIECLRNNIFRNIGVKKFDVEYMGNFNKDNILMYGYNIKNWSGRIRGKNLIWIHKSVLQMHPNSIPFEEKTISKVF